MAAPRGIDAYDARMGRNFHDLDDMQLPRRNLTPIRSISYNQEYQREGTENGSSRQTSKSERSGCCSKRCWLGLCIGLAIGILLVIAVAVPVGVVLSNKSSLGTISSTPNWVGTYQTDDACDTTVCCCFSNQFVVSEPSNNQIQITGSVTGQCSGFPSTISQTASISTDFQAILMLNTQTIRLQLGQDNSYISYVNYIYPVCSGSALRISYNAGSMKSMNLGLVIFILSVTVGIMI